VKGIILYSVRNLFHALIYIQQALNLTTVEIIGGDFSEGLIFFLFRREFFNQRGEWIEVSEYFFHAIIGF
jgi:hypothetical protein